MSASKNPESVSNQNGEFRSRVAPAVPMEQGGHKPGVQASEKDRIPEYSAQTFPAGTAPPESTFQPNPELNNQRMYQKASETISGATSSDVHTGLGHPGQGQTSSELHHDGQHHNKKQGLGNVGLGEVGNKGSQQVDPHDPAFANQRNLDQDVPDGQRGTTGGPAAQERLPETAERVAVENKLER